MNGIVAYAAYIPYFRLDRKAIAAALGQPAGKGTRAVASYDEDTTSMGGEAAPGPPRGARPRSGDRRLRHAGLGALWCRRPARGGGCRPADARGALRHPHGA